MTRLLSSVTPLSKRLPALPRAGADPGTKAALPPAGDCFAAGFLYALSEGMSLPECGRFACAVASCAIECVGATDGIKSVDEPWKRFQSL